METNTSWSTCSLTTNKSSNNHLNCLHLKSLQKAINARRKSNKRVSILAFNCSMQEASSGVATFENNNEPRNCTNYPSLVSLAGLTVARNRPIDLFIPYTNWIIMFIGFSFVNCCSFNPYNNLYLISGRLITLEFERTKIESTFQLWITAIAISLRYR